MAGSPPKRRGPGDTTETSRLKQVMPDSAGNLWLFPHGRKKVQRRERLPRGHTRDAWPCCNTAPEQTYGRPKGGICQKCRELIRTGADALRQREQAQEQTYRWVKQPHWWPQYYGVYRFENEGTRRTLIEAMFYLVNRVIKPVYARSGADKIEPMLTCEGTRSQYDNSVPVSADPGTRECLNALDQAIREALTEAYAEGKKRGQSTLLQLAAGEMSMKDFDDETTIGRNR